MAITAADLSRECAAVCARARENGWKYGDSHTLPPCEDRLVSCDRMVALALYSLGYTDQPLGGITVLNMERYLTSWGFVKNTDEAAVMSGDIVLMSANGTDAPTAAWHAFFCDEYRGADSIRKYDCGAQWRLESVQPFDGVPLNEWVGKKSFYCSFRLPSEGCVSDAPEGAAK